MLSSTTSPTRIRIALPNLWSTVQAVLLATSRRLVHRIRCTGQKVALRASDAGQGLVEYALVLVFVAVAVIAVLTAVGTEVDDVYHEVECVLSGGTWHEDQGRGNSNRCR